MVRPDDDASDDLLQRFSPILHLEDDRRPKSMIARNILIINVHGVECQTGLDVQDEKQIPKLNFKNGE